MMKLINKSQLFDKLAGLFSGDSDPKRITIGVEQEFFLLTEDGRVASHQASQAFLGSFFNIPSTHLVEEEDSGIGLYISAAEIGTGRQQFRVKYDHHPHLLEIEIPPASNIVEMREILAIAMNAASSQAEICGLIAAFVPVLPLETDDQDVWSEHSLCVALRDYRKQVTGERFDVLTDARLLNFSAYITATQFHFGNINWSSLSSLMDALYRMEPDVLPHSWAKINVPAARRLERWAGYLECLGQFPLVAFPRLSSWNVDSWYEALISMPLANTGDNRRGGGVDTDDIMSLFKAKRDLTLIKPRSYGTIEFRSDPCQPSADAVANLCALRLGITSAILSGFKPERDFKTARDLWMGLQRNGIGTELDSHLTEIAREGLIVRSFGEEAFLSG